ncbi:hypothetical protein CC1G_04111 [Coprinopsis cinerea okayama7|uniref:Uncharacterized protein n=1 Tax=Coprinopsis cinerea (strain Okayama-7 / 130 / ATCC MYA-4618 / FGSC 9003) TaxID=240176 RepID=A8NW09_COPC7|nr:hypothetical protein CC1G_04111 [Coprinopsis cinerea okayama7\|eukprot:XP_001836798.1 hypothetical protein CC1G_04111 [Coprinopsis cinerea okayama7\
MPRIAYDDRDPLLRYSAPAGQWVIAWGPVDGTEYMGTRTGSLFDGAEVTFNFEGTRVSVYGLIGTNPARRPTTEYTIDDRPPTRFVAPSPIEEDLHQYLFYESPVLPNGRHTLKIRNIGQNSDFWLDVIWVEQPEAGDPPPPPPPPPVPTPTPTPTTTPSPSPSNDESPSDEQPPVPASPTSRTNDSAQNVTGGNSSVVPTGPPSITSRIISTGNETVGGDRTVYQTLRVKTVSMIGSTQTEDSAISAETELGSKSGAPSGPNAGAIVGGVIGGLALLLLLGFTALFLKRRRGKKSVVLMSG